MEMDMASCVASTFDFDYSGDTDWGSGNIHCEDNMSIKREDDENKTHIPITTVWVKTEVNATGYEPIEIARNKYETHLDTEETSCIENIKNEFVAGSKNSVSINEIENERDEINSTTTFECVKSDEVDVKFEPCEIIGNKDATCLKTEVTNCGYGIIEDNRTEFASNSKIFDSEINEMDSSTTFECIKSEGMDIKCEPIEAVGNTDASEIEERSCGYSSITNIKKAFASDFNHLGSVSRTENEVNEMDSTTTFEYIKSEEIDVKYESFEAVGSSLSEIPTYKCSLCSYEGKRKSYLTRHMKLHADPSEVQMYNCGICSYTTRYRSYWTAHKLNFSHLTEEDKHELKKEQPPEEPLYKCNTCRYSPQDIFKCEKCDYSSAMERNLKVHMLNVHGTEMHRCPTCIYANKHKSRLKPHMLKHLNRSDNKMYKCDKCNYTTAYCSGLISHSLYHKDSHEVQIYSCDQCVYETKYKGALKMHNKRSHTKMLK